MDYATHYARLIDRARGRTLPGYVERHHVLPRCLGGADDRANLVDLTPEEHYVAHQLLVKMHPDNRRLAHAAVYMAVRCTGNKAYGWLRRRKAEAWRGMKHSAETRARMSKSQRAVKRPPSSLVNLKLGPLSKGGAANKGRVWTQAQRDRIATTLRGRKLTPEHRANISTSQVGNKYRLGQKLSLESIEKRSASRRGRPLSIETRAKIAVAHLGKKLSSEHIARMVAGKRGAILSAEHRAKLSAAAKAQWARIRSSATAGSL